MGTYSEIYDQIKIFISADDLLTAISFSAFMVSLISVYFSRLSWLQANRPVVVAFVAEHDFGNVASTFNLVVSNTGNRPATNVRLRVSPQDLSILVKPTASSKRKESISNCFSDSAMIPVLRNGEELSTGFGAYTENDPDGDWLNYGAHIKIKIEYGDLDGRSYKSILPLKIYVREGFGGSFWLRKNK